MKKSFYALFMLVAMLTCQHVNAQEKSVIYNADFNEIAESWTQEGELVENLWSIQSNSYAAYGFNATGDFTNWLVSPNIKLNSSNEVSFNHLAYNSMFNNLQEEAKFVIREVGGEWVEIEGVQYPTGYDIVNSGNLAVPAEFDNKEVQFAFQYKKMGENTGLWGIADIIVKGVEGGAEPDNNVLFTDVIANNFKAWKQEGDNAYTDLWYIYDDFVQCYGYMAQGACTSYLVSPVVKLDAAGNEVNFNHKAWYFSNISEEAQLVIREVGGEWVAIPGVAFPEEGNYKQINSGTLKVPAEFNGKDVQFAFQYKYDQSSIGTWSLKDITVTKAEGSKPEEELELGQIYEETFANGHEAAGFTVEGEQGEVDNYMPLWYFSDGWQTAFGYNRIGYKKNIESYLVSPEIQLYKDNTVEFVHKGSYFEDKIMDYVSFHVREVGGEWVEITDMVYGVDYNEVKTGAMRIPAEFNGKKVQFGFRYTADDAASAGCWQFKNLVVKGMMPKKAEAGLDYGVEEVNYILGEDGEFKAPVLSNPNNLAIAYYSSNPTVATIDTDGNVAIVGQGTTTISASSKETIDFRPGIASYTLNVIDKTIVYSANFYEDFCGFKLESETSDAQVFYTGWDGYLMADAYYKVSSMTTFYFISPEVTLNAAGNAVSMEHKTLYFVDVAKEAQLVIREAGTTEWEEIPLVYSSEEVWFNTGNIAVPAKFNGKNVQFAFKYTADGNATCGQWSIKNLVVKRVIEKADPEIAFEKDAVEFVMGGEDAFVAPALINPNNVAVSYASDNAEVAVVEELTGNVTIIGEGVATITATSVADDNYKSATASYTITVTVPTGIEGITADDITNGKVYDLQGRRVNKLGKGVFIVNGKKVVIK